jgi:hypothetical protein
MVTTRSSAARAQAAQLQTGPTLDSRIEKPKETPKKKIKIIIKMKVKEPISPAECEAETNLMRQINMGEVCLYFGLHSSSPAHTHKFG